MSSEISNHRTKNYFKQLKSSSLIKLLTILCSFIMVPVMIKYLGNEKYGIWSTLLSIVSWVVLFDIGIGNGLRNKISESLAKNRYDEAQGYISTAYVIIGYIALVLFVVFALISLYVPWQQVFNTNDISSSDLRIVINITAFFLFMNFWMSLVNQVFNGLQKSSLVILNQFGSNLLALIFVYILYLFCGTSLIKLAFFYGISLVISSGVISLLFYNKHIDLKPVISKYSWKYAKSITSLGFGFFVIQIACIVLFTTDRILITQLFGPSYVTSYDVVFKLFSIILVIQSLLIAPLWPAYSDAFHRKDYVWMNRTIINQLKIYLLFIVAVVGLMLVSKYIISLWIGHGVEVDNILIISMGGFILVSIWSNIFAYFLNATNKLNVQIVTAVLAMIINVPLSIWFVKHLSMGVYGIVFSTCISLSIFAIIGPIKVYFILKSKYE